MSEGGIATCPECGEDLSLLIERNPRTKEVKVLLRCTSDYDDRFLFEISTGLSNEGLSRLRPGKRSLLIPMNGRLKERKGDPELKREQEDEMNCNRCGRLIPEDAEYYLGILDEDILPYQLCESCGGALAERFGRNWAAELGATKAGVRKFWRWVGAFKGDRGRNWRRDNR